MIEKPLVDSFGRVHSDLRISVTDRCNIRCFYCMPNENVQFQPREQLLSYEEINHFVSIVARRGINQIRITGGEPLVRSDLAILIEHLNEIDGIQDIALTTNGLLLSNQAAALKEAGLNRVNISLDSLDPESFQLIARRKGLDQVLAGIAEAKRVGFESIKLNTLAIKDVNEDQIVPLARFARNQNLELRFIEFMPLDAEKNWDTSKVLSGVEVRARIESALGPMQPVERENPSQPATAFQYADGQGRVGFIDSVSAPFCEGCNRLRLTADGKLRNCLFALDEWDLKPLLRGNATDAAINQLVNDCVTNKKAGHMINQKDFQQPDRAMYQIGG